MLYLYYTPFLYLLINFVLLLRSSTSSGGKGNQFLPRQAQLLLCFPAEIPHGIQSHAPNNRKEEEYFTRRISKKGGDAQSLSNNNNNNQCLITGPFNRYVYTFSSTKKDRTYLYPSYCPSFTKTRAPVTELKKWIDKKNFPNFFFLKKMFSLRALDCILLCVVALYSYYIPYTENVISNWGNGPVSGPSRFIDYRVVCCCRLLYVHQPCINLIGNVHCNSCVYVCIVLLFQTDDVVVANSSECSRGWNDWCRPSSHSIDRASPIWCKSMGLYIYVPL